MQGRAPYKRKFYSGPASRSDELTFSKEFMCGNTPRENKKRHGELRSPCEGNWQQWNFPYGIGQDFIGWLKTLASWNDSGTQLRRHRKTLAIPITTEQAVAFWRKILVLAFSHATPSFLKGLGSWQLQQINLQKRPWQCVHPGCNLMIQLDCLIICHQFIFTS